MHHAPFSDSVGSASDAAEPCQPVTSATNVTHADGPKPKRRVTQMDVARAAGVHNTTVSLALRNCPSIPAATRARIQAVAAQLGYCPDPALRALVAYRRGLTTSDRTETIAYITHCRTKWGWREVPTEAQYFLGAQRKAAECGYRLEHFWLGEPDLSPRRLGSMLFHRGMTGALIASHDPEAEEPLAFDWENLTAIKLGHLPQGPALHRVTCNLEGAVHLATQRALAAGHRRIGMVLPEPWNRAADQAWSSGFITAQSRLPNPSVIPVFVQEHSWSEGNLRSEASAEVARFANWFSTFQPDVVLGSSAWTAGVWPALQVRVPRDLGFVDLLHDGTNPALAGVRQNCERAGEVAVELLIHQLQQNLRGLPATPTTTLVESLWRDGASMPTARVNRWRAETTATHGGEAPRREQTAA